MAESWRPRRSPTRYLAPLALAATIAGTYLVIHHALDGGSSSHRSPISDHRSHAGGPRRRGARRSSTSTSTAASGSGTASGPAFYTVRAGDTLSVIAAATGVPLAQIERLNPRASSTSLQIGQRLRLRR